MAQKVLPGGPGQRNLLGGTHQATRRLGSGVRIYKNQQKKVLGLDSFEVTVNVQQLTTGPVGFHRSVDNINISRTLLHLDTGSRTVADIQMVGDYDSITIDSGDFFVATWAAAGPDENDVVISFEDKVAKVGDTI